MTTMTEQRGRTSRPALEVAPIVVVRVLLVLGAMALFTIAAATIATWLGFAVAGICLLSIEWWVKRT